MIFTFANRTVGLVGRFDTPIEVMDLVVSYLGGRVCRMTNGYFKPEVLIIGKRTKDKVMTDIENHFKDFDTQIVYEGKIDDHMPDKRTFGDLIDRVKQELPWGKFY
jgi:hypothetical protein